MRPVVVAVLATTSLFLSLHGNRVVIAGADVVTTGSGGASFDVSASLAGRYADPQGIWNNPCEAPYVWSSKRLTEDVAARGLSRIRGDGVTEYLWEVKCEDPETYELSYVLDYWISAPTPGDLVADLAEILPGYLDPPDVSWPNASPEHGWLFVKVPMDFRIDNLDSVTVTASVTNAIGTATASATATPSVAAFDSGEGGGTECDFEGATVAYVPGTPSACAYTYQNSSAIAGGSFGSTTTVRWDVTSVPSDPSLPASMDTFTSQALPVSEVQAIVTCSGSGC